ncbi:hypothetical protein AVEN_118751-1 [Araneus ventricosus]|uniref:Uncharacterized protein n=1 Tax=Araneus ventricosus TaxID=182803 RepID=A0A4Y2BY19_ARAVE|nr:hypothetical protein AVEN_118751-1 [Araneus ventricosus]
MYSLVKYSLALMCNFRHWGCRLRGWCVVFIRFYWDSLKNDEAAPIGLAQLRNETPENRQVLIKRLELLMFRWSQHPMIWKILRNELPTINVETIAVINNSTYCM